MLAFGALISVAGSPPLVAQHPPLTPPPEKYGRWETVIPNAGGAAVERVLGMQTVHAVLLPSGKVLWASGSSWRNHDSVQHYPNVPQPKAGTGLFDRALDPFEIHKLQTYYELVNNVGIYDPERNTFYRIPHPVPVLEPADHTHFVPSDLFCTGHLHLPDGSVLFVGGTQYYYPYRTGNRSTWIFDWRKEATIRWPSVDWQRMPNPPANPWIFAGLMPRGRWYPSIVPLLDGRMAVFGGFVGFDPPPDTVMYRFEMNRTIDIFDPGKFKAATPGTAWESIDVSGTPNSPFTNLINPTFTPDSPKECDARCVKDNQYDTFKLYPENYVMPDGRIYMTQEGDWVSLRTGSTAYMRRTQHTYWVTIGGRPGASTIAFANGPARPDTITSYGTTYLDPNTHNITLLGGQPTSAGTYLPMNTANQTLNPPTSPPTHFAGGRGSRKREEFLYRPGTPAGGSWTLDPDFLGDSPQDDRTMHYAITLPTHQVLIINGGNYDFYGPVYYPLLLTPKYSGGKFVSYEKTRMSEGVEPRLYHNTALLLPDGRILVSGGNTARASVRARATLATSAGPGQQPKPNLSLVDVDMYFFGDGPMGKGQPGMQTLPTEDWVAEMYSPPYLFIDGTRRAAIATIRPSNTPRGYRFDAQIGGKTYYLVHSEQTYRMTLTGLPETCGGGTPSLSMIKLSSATHGWENGQAFLDIDMHAVPGAPSDVEFRMPNAHAADMPPAYYMLFYVDCHGKPAVARMVRFDDSAAAP